MFPELSLEKNQPDQPVDWTLLMTKSGEKVHRLRQEIQAGEDYMSAQAGRVKDIGIGEPGTTPRQPLEALEKALRAAEKQGDATHQQSILAELARLELQLQRNQPAFWIEAFDRQAARREKIKDTRAAGRLIADGIQAIEQWDLVRLRLVVQKLQSLSL